MHFFNFVVSNILYKYFQLYLMHKLLKLMAKFKWKLIYTMAHGWMGRLYLQIYSIFLNLISYNKGRWLAFFWFAKKLKYNQFLCEKAMSIDWLFLLPLRIVLENSRISDSSYKIQWNLWVIITHMSHMLRIFIKI